MVLFYNYCLFFFFEATKQVNQCCSVFDVCVGALLVTFVRGSLLVLMCVLYNSDSKEHISSNSCAVNTK